MRPPPIQETEVPPQTEAGILQYPAFDPRNRCQREPPLREDPRKAPLRTAVKVLSHALGLFTKAQKPKGMWQQLEVVTKQKY